MLQLRKNTLLFKKAMCFCYNCTTDAQLRLQKMPAQCCSAAGHFLRAEGALYKAEGIGTQMEMQQKIMYFR